MDRQDRLAARNMPLGPFNVTTGSSAMCYDGPRTRQAIDRFVSRVVEAFKDHEALTEWDIWSEPGKNACQCPHTIAAFREWLVEKYHTLQGLNKAWGMPYVDWNEVVPPASPGSWHPIWIDWMYSYDRIRSACLKSKQGRWFISEQQIAQIEDVEYVPKSLLWLNHVASLACANTGFVEWTYRLPNPTIHSVSFGLVGVDRKPNPWAKDLNMTALLSIANIRLFFGCSFS